MYKHAILGGTFDHFHMGHKKLLDTAFTQSKRITIGIAMPNLYKNKFLEETIEDFSTRKITLTAYLKEKNYFSRATIVPITDIYGTTLTDKSIEAIFVTEENLPNVKKINAKREERGFPALQAVVVPYVTDERGETITSERIRRGEIDRDGFVYASLFQKKLILPDKLRPQLQQPIGKIVKDTEAVIELLKNHFLVFAVGDIISAKLQEHGRTADISIIDFKTRRQELERKGANLVQMEGEPAWHLSVNKQGTITREAVEMLRKMFDTYLQTKKQQILVIDGEEDLLALPAIVLAPLGSVVLYGQYEMGVVVNTVTEQLKKKVLQILKKFT